VGELFTGIRPGSVRVVRGVPVAAVDGQSLTVDVYVPPSNGIRPTVVQIYGGAWQRGSPGDNANIARELAARGFAVFAIDYRHAPRWRWPAQLADVRLALRWVREHAAAYGADSSRIALFGRSAGAQLSMLAAYEPGASEVRAVVNYYGPVDLVDGYRHPPTPDPLDVRAVEVALFGGPPEQFPDAYRSASPIAYIALRRGRLPPTLSVYGGRDHVVLPRYGRQLHERLTAAGATSVLLEIPWAEHAFDALPSGPSAQLALYYTERFLAWALISPAAGPSRARSGSDAP
jgi:acetyl esterase/lipase